MSSPQTAIPFGKYLLIKRLAVGGMAELFLAQRPPNPELVVLKRILPYLSEEPEFVQMFLDEARIAAQLHHPNIVQVHELGKEGDNIFIAMEFVEGVDLRHVVLEEFKFGATVPCGVAARICSLVASGLDYAHQSRGVDGRPLELIHRDVSPQNVMIGYDGRVKLVDFGIAKAGAFMERSKPGVIKGKFLYLAPEQVSQERLDHRADIFALGTMLYEITTGKQPFSKPTTEGILYAIRYEDPTPPHLLRPDYPLELSRIVMRCLTKDRNQRYPRASVVHAELEAFLASGSLQQSLDVSEYIARLMGEEEERTILHIPVSKPVGRMNATVPMVANRVADASVPQRPPPMDVTAPTLSSTTPMAEPAVAQVPGLTARPTPRRHSADGLPAASYRDEPEPATQMARPRELPSGGRSAPPVNEDVDSEMSTAVRTAPTGYSVLSRPGDEEDEDAGDGESTIPLRGRGRTPPPPARRASTHSEVSSAQRGPITPEPLTAPPTASKRSASGPLPVEPPPRAVAPLEPPPSPRAAVLADASAPRTPTDARARRMSSPPTPVAPPRRTPTPVPQDLDDGPGEMTMPLRRQSVVDAEASVSLTTPMRRLSPLDVETSESVSLTTPMRRLSPLDVETSESVSLTTPMRRMSSVELEPSQSVSITPATVSHRAASRPLMPAARAPAVAVGDDDDHFHTDSSLSGALTSPTASLRDGEDDESTMGYGGGYDYSDTSATPARTGSRGLLLVVVGGLLLLVLLSLLCWGLYTRLKGPTPLPIPPRDLSQKAREEQQSALTVPVRSANPPPAPVAAPVVAAAQPTADIAPGPATPEAPAPVAAPEVPVKVEPAPPSLVEVRFEAPPKTVLRQEGGERLPVNRLVSLPPGPLRVDFDCPGRRTGRGTKSYLIEQANPGPLVLPVPCKPRR
ncbi:protein kinase [Myxococcus sp. K38C18041901]|uniref:serine/threonine protein kinase n=1 Tax=Myxococcus guangdongensis TaxID=2906760 RepID=UPI0020A82B62|nr:protein kinase [Myxococcus guangdongensis]MCP3060693.1 protein kinase [Myxococcus guangdongensis]